MIAEICSSSVCLLSFFHHSYYTSHFFCLLESSRFWEAGKKKASPKNKSPNKTNSEAQLKIHCPDLRLSFARIVPVLSAASLSSACCCPCLFHSTTFPLSWHWTSPSPGCFLTSLPPDRLEISFLC